MKQHFLNTELVDTCAIGDLEKIKRLVKRGANIHYQNRRPLLEAVRKGHIDIVDYLVNLGCVYSDKESSMALAAIRYKHPKLLKYFMELGEDLRKWHDTLLMEAYFLKEFESIQYLKSLYCEQYKEKFRCYKCLVSPSCSSPCDKPLIKG